MPAIIWKKKAEGRASFSKYLWNIFGSRGGTRGWED